MSGPTLLSKASNGQQSADGFPNASSPEKRLQDEDLVLEPNPHLEKSSKKTSRSTEALQTPVSKESSTPVSSTSQSGPPGISCSANGSPSESRPSTHGNQNQNGPVDISMIPSQNKQGDSPSLSDRDGLVISLRPHFSLSLTPDANPALTTLICGVSPNDNAGFDLKRSSVALLGTPQAPQMDSTSPLPDVESPVDPPTSSSRSSKYNSGTISKRSSQRQSINRSKHNSISSLRSHRPAPPSPLSSHPSRTNSQMFIPAQMRRESIDSQVSSHPTEHFPSPKPSASSLRSLTNSSTTGRLSISSSRRQSNLAISFTNPYLEGSSNPSPSGEARPIVASPARSENLMSTSGTTQNASITSPNLQSPAMVPPVGPIFALSNAHIRRNFSSTSASTSGSSSSVPSNPGLKHANELAAAYASMGININSPMLGEPADSVIDQQQNNGSSDPLTMNDDDIEWHRAHPIVVRDYAYDEEDERFSMIPVDLMLRCDRPQPMQHTRRASQSRFMTGGGSSYNSGAHYGGRWDPDDEEEDDDWGFPMGSITTASGTEAPLGATRSGPSSQLKNRTRAWNNLGSRSFGGQRINFSEEESSGFYEESGEEEGFDDFGTIHRRQDGDEEDEDDYGEDVQTPSRTYLHSPLRDAVVHPEMDDHHGIDGDDDHSPYSTGDDEEDYENRAPLRSGVYRVVYPFTAEGPSEMSVEKDQLVRVLGRHGHGWALVLRDWTVERAIKGRRESLEGGSRSNEDEPQALVPESYLAVYQLDAEDATFLDR